MDVTINLFLERKALPKELIFSLNQVKNLAEGAGKESGVLIRSCVLEHLKE